MTTSQDDYLTVLRFRNRETMRLRESVEIDLERQTVRTPGQAGDEIGFGELKAIFFFGPVETKQTVNRGSKLSIEFEDGEVIHGMAPEYNPTLHGFYLYPQSEDRVEKVFIVSSAIASIDVERL